MPNKTMTTLINTLRKLSKDATRTPWEIDKRTIQVGGAPQIIGNGRRVAMVQFDVGSEDEEVYYNAHLIIAAVNNLDRIVRILEAGDKLSKETSYAVVNMKITLADGAADMPILRQTVKNMLDAKLAYDAATKEDVDG